MLWRFFPTLDSQVDVFISRDLDSVLKPREVDATEEWLQSGKSLHVMQDHPFHDVPMLGGLWGTKLTGSRREWGDVWKDIWTAIIADPLSKSSRADKGPDQTLLGRHVWGQVPGGVVQHDSYYCSKYPDGSTGFPSQRPNSTGNVAGSEPNRKQDNIECPTQCRKKQSWKFC